MDWNGRIDGYDDDILRIHQVIQIIMGKKYVL